jgi:hypothetical protein
MSTFFIRVAVLLANGQWKYSDTVRVVTGPTTRRIIISTPLLERHPILLLAPPPFTLPTSIPSPSLGQRHTQSTLSNTHTPWLIAIHLFASSLLLHTHAHTRSSAHQSNANDTETLVYIP